MSAQPKPVGVNDPDVVIHHGDSLEVLRTLPNESVQCIITSPPFWGLRDYGVDGQIGLEETPDQWCARLVAVFRECRRILRDDGTLWVEVGDTYNSSASNDWSRWKGGQTTQHGRHVDRIDPSLKPKDLVGAPWLLAFALRADGWFLRSENIWARPNPMPESVTDRPTKAHSTVFLLTKRGRYYYDADAIREGGPQVYRSKAPDGWDTGDGAHGTIHRNGREAGKPAMIENAGANARTVWSIATEPTPFAHFATFPQALVEKCLKAGTSEHGACSACGAPWRRVTERTIENPGNRTTNGRIERSTEMRAYDVRREIAVETLRWERSCGCDAPPRPCVALDPFMGSGTVAIVARRHGRHAIGIELNAEYIAIAAGRLQQLSLLA